jgi:hypothetical protein
MSYTTMAKQAVKKSSYSQGPVTAEQPVVVDDPVAVKSKVVRKSKAEASKTAPEETTPNATQVVAAVPPTPIVPVIIAPVTPAIAPTPADIETTATTSEPPSPTKQRRNKTRIYSELFAQIKTDIDAAYKCLQSATRLINSLESAHNREVTVSKNRDASRRTPTILFDAALVAYYRSKLTPDELKVNHKEADAKVVVDLGNLSVETRLHRTDVTQLYNLIFKKFKMQDPEDGRIIKYKDDAELVALLTTGPFKPELASDVEAIKAGTYKLTIFNIQRFTNQHLSKFEEPAPAVAPVSTA